MQIILSNHFNTVLTEQNIYIYAEINCKLPQDERILRCLHGRVIAGLIRISMYVSK